MKILQVGIMEQKKFQERVLAIASGRYKPRKNEPKIWFSSMRSLCEVLSENNMRLLKIIDEHKPASIKALAAIVDRAPSNLSRTLNTMERYGIIEFKKHGRNCAPVVKALGFNIQYSIAS